MKVKEYRTIKAIKTIINKISRLVRIIIGQFFNFPNSVGILETITVKKNVVFLVE